MRRNALGSIMRSARCIVLWDYDMALECFQKTVEIKRKYMSDIPEKLFDIFSCAVPYIQELCELSMGT